MKHPQLITNQKKLGDIMVYMGHLYHGYISHNQREYPPTHHQPCQGWLQPPWRPLGVLVFTAAGPGPGMVRRSVHHQDGQIRVRSSPYLRAFLWTASHSDFKGKCGKIWRKNHGKTVDKPWESHQIKAKSVLSSKYVLPIGPFRHPNIPLQNGRG